MILLNYQVFLDAIALAMACVARSERKEIVSFIIYTPEYSKFHKNIKFRHYFSSRLKISRSRANYEKSRLGHKNINLVSSRISKFYKKSRLIPSLPSPLGSTSLQTF